MSKSGNCAKRLLPNNKRKRLFNMHKLLAMLLLTSPLTTCATLRPVPTPILATNTGLCANVTVVVMPRQELLPIINDPKVLAMVNAIRKNNAALRATCHLQ